MKKIFLLCYTLSLSAVMSNAYANEHVKQIIRNVLAPLTTEQITFTLQDFGTLDASLPPHQELTPFGQITASYNIGINLHRQGNNVGNLNLHFYTFQDGRNILFINDILAQNGYLNGQQETLNTFLTIGETLAGQVKALPLLSERAYAYLAITATRGSGTNLPNFASVREMLNTRHNNNNNGFPFYTVQQLSSIFAYFVLGFILQNKLPAK